MKGKKPRGTKAKVQAYKKRSTRIALVITVTILVSIIVISSFFVYSSLNSSPSQTINPNQTGNQPSQLKAAIVDHLSLTFPNQTFKETATNTLTVAGYTVDYYPGEEVNVENERIDCFSELVGSLVGFLMFKPAKSTLISSMHGLQTMVFLVVAIFKNH